MADEVKVKLTGHEWVDDQLHAPGDEVTVPVDRAKALVAGGVAAYATVPDAKKAGAEPEAAATKQ